MDAYATLLHIGARHAFFGEHAVGRFRFAPSAATAALLARHDILARTGAEGLTLVCPRATRTALQAGALPALELEFDAWSIGASFSLVTAPAPPAADARLVFHSAGAVHEQQGIWRLHAQPQAGASAWSRAVIPNRAAGLDDGGPRAPRPAFHLLLSAAAIAAALAGHAAPRFLVRFGARQTRWRYYLLGDALGGGPARADAIDPADTRDQADGPQPAIIDLDGVLSFTPGGYTELAGQHRALTFISEQAIDMRQHPPQRLQLCERRGPDRQVNRILIKRLPNASVAAVGREVAPGSNETGGQAVLVSEIYIR
ncbi:hypothetical protein SAMN05428959_10365 [Duganella sp. CF517]|uniref:hypothetical protein n=1 Tax=Duganella sp. CF517 TaxID=1881038 RepID=UPI0008C15475|nr:hypothetical protein [Duganella sp. CF517]SEN77554.1 hypothetical protein SAMN05428959_10365 [Duganella sp. CF517]